MPLALRAWDDPRLDDFRNRSDEELRARGLFLIEGAALFERLCASALPVAAVLLAERRLPALAPLLDGLPPEVPVYTAGRSLLAQVKGAHLHGGVLALGRRGAGGELPPGTLLAVEGVRDYAAVGGLLRTAAAFGLGGALLAESCGDQLFRRALRASAGEALRLPVQRAEDFPAALAGLRAEGRALWALDGEQRGARPLPCARPERAVLLVGELSGRTLALCDGFLAPPGGGSGLGLEAATAVALFGWR